MKKLFVALVACLLAGPASAVVLQIDFSAPTGGQPSTARGSITIDNPFNADVAQTTAGLKVNAVNFQVDSQVGFSYRAATDLLIIGGVAGGVGGVGGSDFGLVISRLMTSPYATLILTQGGTSITSGGGNASVTLNKASAIPLPAGLPLLLGGLAMLGIAGCRRARG